MRKKNKKTVTILSISAIIIVLAVIGFASTAFQISDIERSKYVEAPTFGYLSCSATQSKTVTEVMEDDYGQSNINNPNSATAYTCKDFIGMSESCTITMTVIDGDLTTFGDTRAQLDYQVVTEGNSFNENSATTLPNGLAGYDNMEQVIINMRSSSVLWVRYTESKGTVGVDKYDGKVKFTVTGTPYTLYDHNSFSDTNGQVMAGARSGSCYLESSIYKSRKITYSDPGLTDLKGRELDWSSLNQINGRYTYLAGFTTVPGFDQKVEVYNGKQAYCMNDKMYETLEITVNGYTYSIVNYDKAGFLSYVTCCNGDETPDKLCVNHKWVDKEDAECNPSKGLFCPQSTYQPYGSAQYKRYECDSGKCVTDIIDVECNSDDDCGNGEACVRYANPKDNECVEQGTAGTPVCGDGKCELTEAESCSKDCGSNGSISQDMFWVILIGSALLVIIVMLIVKVRMGK